jgi:hypothetical protein
MATFIQGLTDYIPKAEPYKPNFDFLNSVLATKQARYNSAIDQLSGVYGSIINADLTRDENIESRKNFLNNAQKNIQQITSMDLSDPKNVELAQQVFEPFVQDKKMQYDVMFTKAGKDGKQRAESFRNSVNAEIAGKYWAEGVRGIDYRLLEFKGASPDSAYKMNLPKYVPYVNIMAKAKELVGDDFKDIKIEEQRGNYLVTTTGGPKSVNVISQFLGETLGRDPMVKDYASELAYVQSMDDIMQIASSKYDGDINQAKTEYYLGSADKFVANDENKLQDLKSEYDLLDAKVNIYESKINRGGRLNQKEQTEYSQIVARKNLYENAITGVEQRLNQISDAISNEDIDMLSRVSRSSMASSIISNEISKATQVQAYKDYQVSVKADPFKQISFEKALDFSYWLKKEKIEQDFEREMKMMELGGFDDFSSSTVKTEASMDDATVGDRAEFNNSWANLSANTYELMNTLLNTNDTGIRAATEKILKSSGFTIQDIQSNKVGLTTLNNIFNQVLDVTKADPGLLKSLSGIISRVNDSRQLAYSNISAISSNNKIIAANLRASKAYVPEFLDYVFAKDGSLRDANGAYKVASEAARAKNIVIDKEDFMDDYEDFMDDYQDMYTDLSKNKTGYKPVGRSAAGEYISNSVSGVADFSKPMSKVTSGFKGALDDALNSDSRIGIGTPADIAQASGRDFNSIEDNSEMRALLNTLASDARASKSTISYSYQGRALGSSDYQALIIRPSASSQIMKNLKESNEDLYNQVIAKGITAIIPTSGATNYISQRINTSDREVILNTSGSYRYMNPNAGIDVTFTKKPDQSIYASGTAFNPRTNMIEVYTDPNLNIYNFNTLLSNFDNIQ